MIHLSAATLCKFMHARPAAQRRVLREAKYDVEGKAPIVHYRSAINTIRLYLTNGHNIDDLLSEADTFIKRARILRATNSRAANRLTDNARALRAYAANFAGLKYDLLPTPNLEIVCNAVRITARPDLYVVHRGKNKIIKLHFSAKEPAAPYIRSLTQILYAAADTAGLNPSASSVVLLDVPRGTEHKGGRSGARATADLEAACRNIADLWNNI